MKKGGYQIIDLSAYKFTNGETQSIPNVYNIIKNTKKVFLISGLTIDGTEYHDMFTVFIPYETYFYGLAQYEGNNIYFVVRNDGDLTVQIGALDSPSMYSYNGVVLPDINTVWTDKETYPYAYIIFYTVSTGYSLFIDNKQITVDENGSVYLQSGIAYKNTSTGWVQEGNAVSVGELIWCSVNTNKIVGGVSSLYLEASEPIPVN